MSDELIVRHCAPTLAGLKTGNLFVVKVCCEEAFRRRLRELNRTLASKGLRVIPVKRTESKAWVYVYRPSRLKRDLDDSLAREILRKNGYGCSTPGRCIASLISRMRSGESFPHEIGLFLGYPPEDVRGFIEKGASGCKCSGCWKVYSCEQDAKECFCKYKECTRAYEELFDEGVSLECLAILDDAFPADEAYSQAS